MITVKINPVKCKISGLTEEQNTSLYEYLAYEDDSDVYLKLKSPHLFGVDMKKRLYQPKRQIFGTGLLERVCDFFGKDNIILEDTRVIPDKYLFLAPRVKLPPLRYYQEEARKRIQSSPNATIDMCTGSGKSNVILQTILDRGVNTIILVPTKNLQKQFLDLAEYHFGAKYVGSHKDEILKPIVVANIQGVQKKDLGWWKHFDQIVVDEYHHQSSVSYYELNKKFWEHIVYRLQVSATPFRNDGSDMRLESIAGQPIFNYGAEQAIADGFIVQPHFKIFKVKHFPSPGRNWHWVYENCLVKNQKRNDKIIDVTRKLLASTNKNILLLANRIEHVEVLAHELPDSVVVTGETKQNHKQLEQYKLGKIRCLVATSQVLSEGIDLPQIDILILAGGYESDIMISQSIGRTVRLDSDRGKKFALIIDFMDNGEKILERHSKSRLALYLRLYGENCISYQD